MNKLVLLKTVIHRLPTSDDSVTTNSLALLSPTPVFLLILPEVQMF